MAYEPINWQIGDIITSARLNRMDRGWDVETTELFSETVTAASAGVLVQLAYSGTIDADTITVNFDGTEYECENRAPAPDGDYGAVPRFPSGYNFSAFPFYISSGGEGNKIAVETVGEHTVSVTATSMQTSADFDIARGYGYVTSSPTELFSETVTTAVDEETGNNSAILITYSQLIDANSITAIFDSTEYVLPRIGNNGNYFYGGFNSDNMKSDFTTYPFFIWSSDPGDNRLITQTAGEHTISVTASVTSMKTSADFIAAVRPVIDDAIASVPTPLLVTIGRTTWAEVNSALKAGRPALVWNHTTQRNQPDTYEFVARAMYTSWTVYTLAVDNGAVVVNTYQASSSDGVLMKVTNE